MVERRSFTYGWAYGSKSGYKVSRKKIAWAMSVGINEYGYNATGKYKYTLTELTRPFELTFEYIKADYRLFFSLLSVSSISFKRFLTFSAEASNV